MMRIGPCYLPWSRCAPRENSTILLPSALVVLLLTAGCVARRNVNNWQPQDGSASSAYYECFRQAQQSYATASASRSYGSATASTDTNDDMLCACMAAKGYALRKATTTETVVGVVTSPIWIPVGALVVIGEGMSGSPPKRWIGCP
jgi:hypothetical protein